MNPIIMHVAAGMSLFSGSAMMVVAVGLALTGKRWWLRLANLLGLVGLVAVGVSATPFPSGFYVVLGLVFLGWFLQCNFQIAVRRVPLRWRHLMPGLLVGWVGVLSAMEFPHVLTPQLAAVTDGHMYVIGDSISAGIGTKTKPWPRVYAEMYGVEVTNLASPGIVTADAIPLAAKITDRDALTLIEIGGNDLLGSVPAEEFAKNLDVLLAAATARCRVVVMMELPLFPLANDYGRAQRAVAAKYHVALIPKRVFAGVLAMPGATEDGLHLGPVGTRAMAEALEPILRAARAVR